MVNEGLRLLVDDIARFAGFDIHFHKPEALVAAVGFLKGRCWLSFFQRSRGG